ncbi:mandelate racemase/muconate lactonizing enzyme family protein [Haloarchaeobius salinus]|uniref:mandelate racemase/muconate lactonizing enzyme family protein n=1 Tax=Haloarchaeobius salinus TaxID=1198298 RepID=UPI002108C3EA|nr:enolase C-terminal domain-like protein [Haloarchaeobius salinus]
MKVTAVKTIPVSVPAETAYKTSLSLASEAEHKFEHVLVQIETDAGVTGLGESAPLSSWPHGLSQGAVNSLIEETLAPVVEGRRLENIPRIIDDCWQALPGEPFPLCGIDMALWDALGKARDLPVYDLLGGPANERPSIDLHYTIGIKEPRKVRSDVKKATDAGYSAIKIKVGGPDFAIEREAITAIAEAAPDTRIRIDANQGWTVPEALRRIPILDDAAGGLVLVEQPIDYDNIAGMARLRGSVSPPILADEACFGPRSVATLARADACDIVNVKLGKAGGFSRASDVATVADAHGLPCFMGGMLELGVGAAANAHFAASCPNITYPTGALHVHATDTLVQEQAQWTPETGTFTVPDTAGLGVTLDRDAVAQYRVD